MRLPHEGLFKALHYNKWNNIIFTSRDQNQIMCCGLGLVFGFFGFGFVLLFFFALVCIVLRRQRDFSSKL